MSSDLEIKSVRYGLKIGHRGTLYGGAFHDVSLMLRQKALFLSGGLFYILVVILEGFNILPPLAVSGNALDGRPGRRQRGDIGHPVLDSRLTDI